jgi:hypothetical protein
VSDERMFPVLSGGDYREYARLGMPREVPWRLLAPHEAQALYNHGQTLQRLSERGGLGPAEMRAVVEGLRLRDVMHMKSADEYAWLVTWLARESAPREKNRP